MTLISANVTSWKSAKRFVQDARDDILMIQESKATKEQIEEYRTMANRNGYAVRGGEAKGRSAGVILAWKRHLAVKEDPICATNDRVVTMTLRTRCMGEVVIGSLYAPQ